MSKYAEVHADPKGPGDARPTAMQIVQDEGLAGGLTGKVCLITGASSGLGVETARALHATGADVYITARDLVKAQKVIDDIVGKSSGKGKLEVLKCELDSLASVRECAEAFLRKSEQLNLLICNAGVMACAEGQTKDGFESQFGTNHLGHFLLFELLKPALLRSSSPEFNSRVVCLTSSGHQYGGVHFDDLDLKKQGYHPWIAYGQAKTANAHMALEIERRYGAQGLHASAVMPGYIFTELQRHVDEDTKKMLNSPESANTFKNVEQGAATTVWAAISKDWADRGGRYLEDCGEAKPAVDGGPGVPIGYKPHIYDVEAAKRLWEVSEQLVGLAK